MLGIGFWESVVIAVVLGLPILGALVVLSVILLLARAKNRVLCRACGRPVDSRDRFCRACGAALGRPVAPVTHPGGDKRAAPEGP